MAVAANTAGIRFSGHVPIAVGVERALELKYDRIDHLDGYVEALAGKIGEPSDFFGLNMGASIDESRIAALVTQPAPPARRWCRPKRSSPTSSAKSTVDELKARPEIVKHATPAHPRSPRRRRLVPARLRRAADVEHPGLLDAPRAARYYRKDATTGTVAAKKRADLVLVGGNPLQNIAATMDIAGVMIGGRYYTPGELLKSRPLRRPIPSGRPPGARGDVQCTSMKRYTVAQVRERLSTALDEAAQGIPVLIERRGVRYRLSVERRPSKSRRTRPRIVTLDDAVAAGEWQWTPSSDGLVFKGGRRKA